jgi:hypothetical protein
MVVACIALLVSLGGTGVATVNQLGRNSVGTPQLKAGAVTNAKIRDNAITSAKIANRSLLRVDFAPGQLPAGPTGPQGPTGPAGAAGPAGPPGAIGAITVRTQSLLVPGGPSLRTGRVAALCTSPERAISAGTSWSDQNPGLRLFTSELRPRFDAENRLVGFEGVGANDSGQSSTFTVHVLCYRP